MNFDRLCAELSLGALMVPPVRLYGGYSHRMFRLTTDKGDHAVKLLNPQMMQRPHVLENYRTAEGFEALLEKAGLPILPARVIGGRKMHCVDGQYLYVFDYYDGRMLADGEITPVHCAKVGAALAGVHGSGEPSQSAGADSSPGGSAFWQTLADDLLSSDDAREEGELLRSAVPMLVQVSAAVEEAVRQLPQGEVLCHNDMDPKNVLWRGVDFRIIDLECLGYANPAQELLDLAVSWGGGQEARFKAFVEAYYGAGGARVTDAAAVYDSRRNYIDWLAYNAKRALDNDVEERRVAREQVRWTLNKISNDVQMRQTILRWMDEV